MPNENGVSDSAMLPVTTATATYFEVHMSVKNRIVRDTKTKIDNSNVKNTNLFSDATLAEHISQRNRNLLSACCSRVGRSPSAHASATASFDNLLARPNRASNSAFSLLLPCFWSERRLLIENDHSWRPKLTHF